MHLYKRGKIFWAKLSHKQKARYFNTKMENRRAATERAEEWQRKFLSEQDEFVSVAARLDCEVGLLARCPECATPFRTDRAVLAVDGIKVCGEACREKWNKKANPIPTLEQFFQNEFLPHVEARAAMKQKSNGYYKFGSELLCDAGLGTLRLDEISSKHAVQFAAKVAARKRTPSTANCGLRTLRHALRTAWQWGKIPAAPFIPLAKGERQRDRVVSDADFAAYLDLCRQPWRDVVLLVRGEGMRPSEVFALRWECILLNGDGRGLILITQGKSKAARRQLPMTPLVYDALASRYEAAGKPESGWVFPVRGGNHIDHGAVRTHHRAALTALKVAHEAAKKITSSGNSWTREIADITGLESEFIARHTDVLRAGVKAFVPYELRHTALTRFAESGCDAFTLAKIAGHSTIAMTARYVHPQQEAIAGAFAKVATAKALLQS